MTRLIDRLQREGAVLLETVHPDDERRRVWLFDRPIEVLAARSETELGALLQRLNEATSSGLFVAGYLSYEAGYALEPASGALHGGVSPLAWFGVYDAPATVDDDVVAGLVGTAEFTVTNVRFAYEKLRYAELFRRVKHHVYEGDVYQVNLTGQLRFEFEGSPMALYGALARAQLGGYGAFINDGSTFVLSRSPELFFLRTGSLIRTRPMKGTAPRGTTASGDEAAARALRSDPKSRAENLMIVDLLRNDLSVVCEPGSVRVPELFQTEAHETLIQMTSTVEGCLRQDASLADIVRALFPCGSVTGAPKIRSMRLIQELEDAPRGVYCGSIGWAGPHQQAVFNVAIRTVAIDGRNGRMGLGSGLVWDSDLDEEYEECLLKGRFFRDAVAHQSVWPEGSLALIETMRWDGASIPLLSFHLRRLASSAAALGFAYDEPVVVDALARATRNLESGSYRIRMLFSHLGEVTVKTLRLDEPPEGPVQLAVSSHRVAAADALRRHKTTRREPYEALFRAGLRVGADEVLMLNERNEVCEGTRTNIVVRRAGVLLTPPVSSGLLPGVYRAYLLETRDDITESVLSLNDLLEAEQLFVCNAVQGMRAASLLIEPNGGISVVDVSAESSTAPGGEGKRASFPHEYEDQHIASTT